VLQTTDSIVLAKHGSRRSIHVAANSLPALGFPTVLFVDQQTTRGYLKIANVISADLLPRRTTPAARTSEIHRSRIPEAIQFLREQDEWLKQIFQ
jgi:allophanate hydrolase subunit 2